MYGAVYNKSHINYFSGVAVKYDVKHLLIIIA